MSMLYHSRFPLLFSTRVPIEFIQRLKGTKAATVIKPLRVKSLARRESTELPNYNASRFGKGKGKKFGFQEKVSTQLEENELDYFENHAHSISKYTSKANFRLAEENFKRETIKQLYRARAQTIERKFFKKPEPPNLLTWAAKEQIRFLHEKYPEEWTVDRLADSFPVNKACIKKVLSTRLRLHRDEDIIQHDLEVKKNWTDLKEAIENEKLDEDSYNNLKNAMNQSLISNASGISVCPSPPIKKKALKLGPFSSIVKDCLITKEKNVKDEVNLKEKLARLSSVLANVSELFDNSLKSKSSSSENLSDPSETDKADTKNFEFQSLSKYRQRALSKSSENNPVTDQYKNMSSDKLRSFKQGSKNVKYYISGNSVYDDKGDFLYKVP